MPDGGFSIYVLRDVRNVCLYVGITGRGMRRSDEHSDKPWWTYVDHNEWPHHNLTENQARKIEKELIHRYHPCFNTVHNFDLCMTVEEYESMILGLGTTPPSWKKLATVTDDLVVCDLPVMSGSDMQDLHELLHTQPRRVRLKNFAGGLACIGGDVIMKSRTVRFQIGVVDEAGRLPSYDPERSGFLEGFLSRFFKTNVCLVSLSSLQHRYEMQPLITALQAGKVFEFARDNGLGLEYGEQSLIPVRPEYGTEPIVTGLRMLTADEVLSAPPTFSDTQHRLVP